MDRWPFDIAWDTLENQLRPWLAAFTNAATELAQKNLSEKVEFRAHMVKWYQGKYKIDIPIFDREDRTPQLYGEAVNPSSVTNLSVPDVPGHYPFDKNPMNQRVHLEPARASESSADIARHEAAEKLCQAVCFKLYGKIASKSTKAGLASEEMVRLGNHRHHKKNGSYGGVRMYTDQSFHQRLFVAFRPSWFFVRDVDGYIPQIMLRSLQSVQVFQVMAAIEEGWASSGHSLIAWEAGAIEASMLNEKRLNDGLARHYKCTEEEATTIVHVCQQCRRMKVCSTLLIDDYGNMGCTECDDEQQKDTQFARFMKGRRIITKPDISDGEYWAWDKFISVQNTVYKKLNIENPTWSEQTEAWESFRDKHGVLQDGEPMMRDNLTATWFRVE